MASRVCRVLRCGVVPQALYRPFSISVAARFLCVSPPVLLDLRYIAPTGFFCSCMRVAAARLLKRRHHLPRTNRQPPLRRPIAWALIVGGSLQVFTSLATRTAFVPSGSPVSMLLPRPTPTRRTLHLTQDVESFARSYVLQAGVCAREEERLVNLKVRCLLVGCRLHLKVALVGLDRRCLLRPAFHQGVFFCCFLGS